MKILHLTSSDRWTGAAAPAYAEVEALRASGIEASFAYVPGYTLEEKIGHQPFTRALIERQQNPWTFSRGIQRVRRIVEAEGYDIVHSHLTYDHWLSVFAARKCRVKVIRTFHALRPLRDPLATPYLLRSTQGVAVVNASFETHPYLRRVPVMFTPPPVDHRQFTPDGQDVRALYGFNSETPVVGYIGKVSPGRGFEEAIRVFGMMHRRQPSIRMLIVGRGPHRPFLEGMIRELDIAPFVVWAGYHEEQLAQHYRTMNVMLFTVTGSDEGHRAVSEAMACGTPVLCYPIPGIEAVVGTLTTELVCRQARLELMTDFALSLLRDRAASIRSACAAETTRFGFGPTAERLRGLYTNVLEQS